jgi:hypothetical protein
MATKLDAIDNIIEHYDALGSQPVTADKALADMAEVVNILTTYLMDYHNSQIKKLAVKMVLDKSKRAGTIHEVFRYDNSK